jgi:SAM-dependent methyltransferase
VSDAELDRIRAEYAARDAAGQTRYRWDNPSYVSYMQRLEGALLRAFRDARVELSGASILDVGCGTGYFLHRLREYGGGECHGVDLAENRIAEARARYPALDWRVASATDLPFDDAQVDVVTQFTCLSSIVDDEARLAVAREMSRVARGWVLSFDMRAAGSGAGTPTVGLDRSELTRLFGEPMLLRRVRGLGTLPLRASHYLGLWRAQSER